MAPRAPGEPYSQSLVRITPLSRSPAAPRALGPYAVCFTDPRGPLGPRGVGGTLPHRGACDPKPLFLLIVSPPTCLDPQGLLGHLGNPTRNHLGASGAGMLRSRIIRALRVSECFGFQYVGRFRGQNTLVHNTLGASGAEKICFTILWALPGPKWFVLQYFGRFQG